MDRSNVHAICAAADICSVRLVIDPRDQRGLVVLPDFSGADVLPLVLDDLVLCLLGAAEPDVRYLDGHDAPQSQTHHLDALARIIALTFDISVGHLCQDERMFLAVPAPTIEPTFVETLTAWSTLAAAVATTASVVFIAWQIGLTRKSVQATEKTLEVAREEFENGRLLEVEAQRARIDAEMPRLFVGVTYESTQAWLPDSMIDDGLSREPQAEEITAEKEFSLPRDAGVRVQVGLGLTVTNDGPRRAMVYVDPSFDPVESRRTVIIEAGKGTFEWIRRTHTVGEWVKYYEDRERGETTDVAVAWVNYVFPGDVGAIEHHKVLQGGSPLEPDPERMGVWRLAKVGQPFGPAKILGTLGTGVMPFTREYYASMTHMRPLGGSLPDLSAEPKTEGG